MSVANYSEIHFPQKVSIGLTFATDIIVQVWKLVVFFDTTHPTSGVVW